MVENEGSFNDNGEIFDDASSTQDLSSHGDVVVNVVPEDRLLTLGEMPIAPALYARDGGSRSLKAEREEEQKALMESEHDIDRQQGNELARATERMMISEEEQSNTAPAQDHTISSVTGDSRFDDAPDDSFATPRYFAHEPPHHDDPIRRCWSDEEIEAILMSTTMMTNTPQNVLDFRCQWPNTPIPDTRQVNRVLYKLSASKSIQKCPSNGKNKKPCWKRQSA